MNDERSMNEQRRDLHDLQEELNAEAAFEKDAAEGSALLDHAAINAAVSRINHRLDRDLKKGRRRKKAIGVSQTSLIAVITVLLLIILVWIVMRAMN